LAIAPPIKGIDLMSKTVAKFAIEVDRVEDFAFTVRFDKPSLGELRLDEPPPLGKDSAPNPARVLAAAVGTCLSASLLFCLQRAHHTLGALTSHVEVELVRNDNGRLRVGGIDVTLRPELSATENGLGKCIGEFEDFCIVTQSVREGLEVKVKVEPILLGADGRAAS
jgi:organic hydroperoxide reductase OsmC/OhrA